MRISELRKNIKKHKIIDYPGQDFKVALVKLDASELIESNMNVAQTVNDKPVFNPDILALMEQIEQLAIALRNPDDLNEKVITPDELGQEDSKIIEILYNEFAEIQIENADTLNEISEADFKELKKKLAKMQWKDLDGESLKILSFLHQTLLQNATITSN